MNEYNVPVSAELQKVHTHGTDVASAATLNLEAATGEIINITGTTTVTAITLSDGHTRVCRATGVFTLTHGASLVLPGAVSITTQVGDIFGVVGYPSGVVYIVGYQPPGIPLGSTRVAVIDVTEAIDNMNSTTLVDSTALQLTLGAGVYFIETHELLGDSSLVGLNKSKMVFTGSYTIGGNSVWSTSVASTNGPLNCTAYQITGIAPNKPAGVPTVGGFDMDASVALSNSGGWTIRKGKLTVTASGVLKIQSAQNVANLSSHWLFNGSFLKAIRIG